MFSLQQETAHESLLPTTHTIPAHAPSSGLFLNFPTVFTDKHTHIDISPTISIYYHIEEYVSNRHKSQ